MQVQSIHIFTAYKCVKYKYERGPRYHLITPLYTYSYSYDLVRLSRNTTTETDARALPPGGTLLVHYKH